MEIQENLGSRLTMTFEEAMKVTAGVGKPGVYSDESLRLLWDSAMAAPEAGDFLEVGCEYGKSTSLLAQAAKSKSRALVLIDPFVRHIDGTPGAKVAASLVEMLVGLDAEFVLFRGMSAEVQIVIRPLSLVHIDGNHSEPFLRADIARFLPWVVDGGFACFHDYGDPGEYAKDVKLVIDEIVGNSRWIGKVSDTLYVAQRLGAYESYYAAEGGRP